MTVRKIAIANVAGGGDIVLHVAARQASGLSVSKRGRIHTRQCMRHPRTAVFWLRAPIFLR